MAAASERGGGFGRTDGPQVQAGLHNCNLSPVLLLQAEEGSPGANFQSRELESRQKRRPARSGQATGLV